MSWLKSYSTSHNIQNHTIKSYQNLEFHLTHNFIKLHITLAVPAHHHTNTFIESLSYYVNLYIYMISKPKSFKIRQSIIIKHFILINSTNYSNISINSFNSKLIHSTTSIISTISHFNLKQISFPFSIKNTSSSQKDNLASKIWDWWPCHLHIQIF